MSMRRVTVLLVVVIALGLFADQAHARKRHTRRRERISNAVRLPTRGVGYEIPTTWARRGLHWGTRDLVDLIRRTALRVNRYDSAAILYVADLSLRRGGRTPWHRSHKNGRDADLLFFATDTDGQPARPPAMMPRFGRDGVSDCGRYVFDASRNWLLVKAILTDRQARVSRIFVASHLERMILEAAESGGESEALLRRAEQVLSQPSDSAPHDDHFHIRIVPGRAVSSHRI